MPRQITIKRLKTRQTENLESSKKETTPYLQWKNNSNISGFLIGNHGGQKEVAQYISSIERKELPTLNAISSEYSLRK